MNYLFNDSLFLEFLFLTKELWFEPLKFRENQKLKD